MNKTMTLTFVAYLGTFRIVVICKRQCETTQIHVGERKPGWLMFQVSINNGTIDVIFSLRDRFRSLSEAARYSS